MLQSVIAAAVRYHSWVNIFFAYSLMGWVMECIVIRREKGYWENRGFVHGPFCIIYGFGAMIGYTVLQPIAHNYVLLYFVGAIGATVFEFLTALLMKKLFGNFWWDYTNKKFQYKGMICLESTIGWGFAGLVILGFLHENLCRLVQKIPTVIGLPLAMALVAYYCIDFIYCLHTARSQKKQAQQEPIQA